MPTSGTSVALNRIGRISVVIHDLDRAIAFYRDVLGMRFLFQVPPRLAFFDCGGTRLMLEVPESPEFDHPGSVLYFTIDDIQSGVATLKAGGGSFVDIPHLVAPMKDHDLWMVFFRDPDQNLLALMSEVKRE